MAIQLRAEQWFKGEWANIKRSDKGKSNNKMLNKEQAVKQQNTILLLQYRGRETCKICRRFTDYYQ